MILMVMMGGTDGLDFQQTSFVRVDASSGNDWVCFCVVCVFLFTFIKQRLRGRSIWSASI